MLKKIIGMFLIVSLSVFASLEDLEKTGGREGYLMHREGESLFFIDEENKTIAVYSSDYKRITTEELSELVDMGQTIEGDREFFKSFSSKTPETVAFSKEIEGEGGFVLIFEDMNHYSPERVEKLVELFEGSAVAKTEVMTQVKKHHSTL